MGIIQEVGLLMKEEIRAYWLIQLTKKKVSMILIRLPTGRARLLLLLRCIYKPCF